MVNGALGDLGDTLLKNRMMQQQQAQTAAVNAREQQNASVDQDLQRQRLEMERRNYASEDAYRKQEAAARDKSLTQKQAPRITAYIADPDKPNEGMGFEGDFDQLQQIKTAAEAKNNGKKMAVYSKPPSSVEHEVASFTIGGSTHKFYTQKQADDYEAMLRSKGIDPDTVKTDAKESTQTIEEEYPEVQAVEPTPAVHHWFGADTPGTPGTPYQPKRTVRRTVPVTAPTAATPDLAPGLPNLAPQAAPAAQAPAAPPAQTPTPAKNLKRMPWEPPQQIGFDPTNTPPEMQQVLQEANKALKNGADYGAVTNRLAQQYGITLK